MKQSKTLTELESGDLETLIDFRQVYAMLLKDWFGVESKTALGGEFEKLTLL